MPTEQALPADDPRMIAWKAYQGTDDYANSFRWAAHEEHRAGSMWAAFIAGWTAAPRPPALTPDEEHLIGDLLARSIDDQASRMIVGSEVRSLIAVIRRLAPRSA